MSIVLYTDLVQQSVFPQVWLLADVDAQSVVKVVKFRRVFHIVLYVHLECVALLFLRGHIYFIRLFLRT